MGALLILALTVPVGMFALKTNFLGNSGQNTLTVSQTLPLGASLEARDAAAQEVEAAIVDLPGVESVQTSIGSGGNSLRAAFAGTGSTTFSITTDESFDQVELQQTIRDAVADLGDDAGEVTLSAGGGGGFSSSDVEVNITAASSDDLAEATATVLDAMRDLDIVAEATSNLSEEQPFVEIRVDRVKAAEFGLSEVAVGGIITQAMNPSSVGEVTLGDDVTSIYILNSDAPVSIQQIRDFAIFPGVVLSDLAAVEEVEGPSSITTIKGVRSGTVTVTPGSDDVGTASAQIQARARRARPARGHDHGTRRRHRAAVRRVRAAGHRRAGRDPHRLRDHGRHVPVAAAAAAAAGVDPVRGDRAPSCCRRSAASRSASPRSSASSCSSASW